MQKNKLTEHIDSALNPYKLLNIFEFFGITVLDIFGNFLYIVFCRMITKTLIIDENS